MKELSVQEIRGGKTTRGMFEIEDIGASLELYVGC